MKKILVAVVLAVSGLCLALMTRLGAFRPVALEAKEAGPFLTVYRAHEGAYHKIVPAIQAVEAWAKLKGEPCRISFGEYLDDPGSVDEDRLRSNGGCFVEAPPPDLPPGFKTRSIERRLWLTASFHGAPSIGPFKVYPRAAEWMRENGWRQDGATLETYRVITERDVETVYYFPIARREGEASSSESPRAGQ